MLTGPGERGEAKAKRCMAPNTEQTGPDAPKPGEGPSKEQRDNGMYDLLYCRESHPTVVQVPRISVKGDRDPGYGSTSKMISRMRDLPAARYAGRSGRDLDAGRGDGHTS